MAPRIHICIDATDPESLAPFWAAALGYEVGESLPGGPYLRLHPPDEASPVVYLQRVPEPKAGKNRLHLDLRSAEPAALVGHLVEIGAKRLGPPQSGQTCKSWQVMADPAGNEFCVCDDSGGC